jgi:multidrug resistance efflux pump
MAAPNYSFEKRKRDNAKKAAKEAKRLRKLEKGVSSSQIIEQAPAPEAADAEAEEPASP